jgi:8-oxo-dGTP diphosphatase
MKLVRVAGGLVWRDAAGGPRLAVVHRAKRDDWSFPKGRLDPGEGWQEAARREIAEETGCAARLGRFAGAKLYLDRPEPKLVLYWHARLIHQFSEPEDEVDEVAWLSRREALDRLDHGSDRRLLLRALGAEDAARAAARGAALRGPDDLRALVMVDGRRAEEALPSVLGIIARVIAGGARRAVAPRA